MINFGLYHTCDYVIIVVEPTRNSIKVAQQIYHLCEKSNINYGFVINKSLDSNSLEQLYDCLPHKILACLAYDKGLFAYNYQEISSETKQQVETLYNFLSSYRGFDLYERLMKLHSLKGIS